MSGAAQALDTSSPAFARTIGQILRVNYAGEYGAIRIYNAQIAVARVLSPARAGFLQDTVAHEKRHAAAFLALMPSRGTRPCGATALWGIGGTMLGFWTGLMGSNAMMVCTEAVERTVHAHLNRQIAWLGGRDVELLRVIAEIRDEEVGHHDQARAQKTADGALLRLLDRFVVGVTALLIWCSTYGALTRMKTAMAA
jgi:ubiquinone biosynthesis monooxygenase Coq7